MDTPLNDPPPQAPELKVTLHGSSRPGLPLLSISGALGPEGWQHIREACSSMTGRIRGLDFSGVTHVQTTTDDAASFGRQLVRQSIFHPRLPRHLFIAPGDLLYGLCRIVAMNLDHAGIGASVFRSLDAALLALEQEKRQPDPGLS